MTSSATWTGAALDVTSSATEVTSSVTSAGAPGSVSCAVSTASRRLAATDQRSGERPEDHGSAAAGTSSLAVRSADCRVGCSAAAACGSTQRPSVRPGSCAATGATQWVTCVQPVHSTGRRGCSISARRSWRRSGAAPGPGEQTRCLTPHRRAGGGGGPLGRADAGPIRDISRYGHGWE